MVERLVGVAETSAGAQQRMAEFQAEQERFIRRMDQTITGIGDKLNALIAVVDGRT